MLAHTTGGYLILHRPRTPKAFELSLDLRLQSAQIVGLILIGLWAGAAMSLLHVADWQPGVGQKTKVFLQRESRRTRCVSGAEKTIIPIAVLFMSRHGVEMATFWVITTIDNLGKERAISEKRSHWIEGRTLWHIIRLSSQVGVKRKIATVIVGAQI